MKKILIYIIMILLMILPIYVKANIICNDGTVSATCTTCRKGCCSKHGGCSTNQTNSNQSRYSNKSNNGSSNNSSGSSNGITNDTAKSSNNINEDTDEKESVEVEDNSNTNRNEKNSYIKQESTKNNNVSVVDNKEENDSGSMAGGIATLSVIGVIIYAIKKRKK